MSFTELNNLNNDGLIDLLNTHKHRLIEVINSLIETNNDPDMLYLHNFIDQLCRGILVGGTIENINRDLLLSVMLTHFTVNVQHSIIQPINRPNFSSTIFTTTDHNRFNFVVEEDALLNIMSEVIVSNHDAFMSREGTLVAPPIRLLSGMFNGWEQDDSPTDDSPLLNNKEVELLLEDSDKNNYCPITYEPLKWGDLYRRCTLCKYNFSQKAIDTHLSVKKWCPMCKAEWKEYVVFINKVNIDALNNRVIKLINSSKNSNKSELKMSDFCQGTNNKTVNPKKNKSQR